MFGSETLEVAIGIIFVFVLVSILCSAIREGIESLLKTRAAYLERGIRQLLNDKKGNGLAKSLYEHPLIYSLFFSDYTPGNNRKRPSLFARGGDLPSYIPAKNFAVALMDIAARGADTDEVSGHPESPVISLEGLRTNIQNFDNPFVQRALLSAIDSAQGSLEQVQKNIEEWYDSGMDRVSGWYRRSTQWIIFGIALLVAIGLNINTIVVADYLIKNDAARATLVARAEAASKDTNYSEREYEATKKELASLGLPIGWGDEYFLHRPSAGIWNTIFLPLLGWLVTALAAVMGAPFWFDILNKVMVIRSTVKPHEKSPEEGSEDRLKADAGLAAIEVGERGAPSAYRSRGAETTTVTGMANIRDADTNVDGCDVEITDITPDDELPPAQGGVA